MNRFWEKIIRPILLKEQPKNIVEIGADYGFNTIRILEYCKWLNAKVYVVDPLPKFDVNAFQNAFGKHLEVIRLLSHDALPQISEYDVVLIDGDHNWYTVYFELKAIEERSKKTGKFPLVFFHDVDWPYGRRDMYYNPQQIPAEYLKPYALKGMIPGQSQLAEEGGINHNLYNAAYENGPKNGVLTAIEDFLRDSSLNLSFQKVTSENGLGVMYENDPERDTYIRYVIASSGM
ncbi:class I SAM-dependent methyltransferase [Brevibacillus laterosporus]|uniref:class I SAM-dependent methyltransferase n=1 Tax=Brevibacillus laterosporus TaxID=1465 RepID=UPI000839C053|nr:class I SAM-dependent methyltransferase [Brevibacillus laterosporus]